MFVLSHHAPACFHRNGWRTTLRHFFHFQNQGFSILRPSSIWNPVLSLESQNIEAAVALIRINKTDPEYLILKRAVNPNDPWSGHLSFPGGRRESLECDLFVTVVRECFEECKIRLQRRHLSSILPVAAAGNALGNPVLVQPYFFELKQPPNIQLNPDEVQSAMWLPESHVLQCENHHTGPIALGNKTAELPFCQIGQDIFWGFSYKVLMNFLWQAGRIPHNRFASVMSAIHHSPHKA